MMRKFWVRVIAVSMLILSLSRIIEYAAKLPVIDILGWIWTAVIVYAGLRLFAFHETGRVWALWIMGIYLVLAVILGLVSPFANNAYLSFRLLVWSYKMDNHLTITLFAGLLALLVGAAFFYLRQKETRDLFTHSGKPSTEDRHAPDPP